MHFFSNAPPRCPILGPPDDSVRWIFAHLFAGQLVIQCKHVMGSRFVCTTIRRPITWDDAGYLLETSMPTLIEPRRVDGNSLSTTELRHDCNYHNTLLMVVRQLLIRTEDKQSAERAWEQIREVITPPTGVVHLIEFACNQRRSNFNFVAAGAVWTIGVCTERRTTIQWLFAIPFCIVRNISAKGLV